MSPRGVEPRTPAFPNIEFGKLNSDELSSYKSGALTRLSYGLLKLTDKKDI